MKEVLLYINGFIFILIALMHFYWAFGGRYGLAAAIPEKFHAIGMNFKIGMKLATLFMAFVFLSIGLLYLYPMLNLDLSWVTTYYKILMTCIVIILLIRAVGDFNFVGFFKKDKRGLFARNDSQFYVPLCFYLAIITIYTIY